MSFPSSSSRISTPHAVVINATSITAMVALTGILPMASHTLSRSPSAMVKVSIDAIIKAFTGDIASEYDKANAARTPRDMETYNV